MIGSGGLVVMDEDTCMVETARFFMSFTQNESCGKCVPCREGTKRMLEILDRIIDNEGSAGGSRPAGGAGGHHHATPRCAAWARAPASPCRARCGTSARSIWPMSSITTAPSATRPQAPSRHRSGAVQGLRQVPAQLSRRRHRRSDPACRTPSTRKNASTAARAGAHVPSAPSTPLKRRVKSWPREQ